MFYSLDPNPWSQVSSFSCILKNCAGFKKVMVNVLEEKSGDAAGGGSNGNIDGIWSVQSYPAYSK